MEGLKKWVYILISLILVGTLPLKASHLMGGNLGYEYLGLQSNGKYRYKIKLTTYVDCGPSSEIPYAEYPIKVGVYANDLLNPNADKMVVDSLLLYVDDTIVYTPFLPPGCNIGENTCIIQARYSGFIELDASIHGYYLFYERCCRNAAIINLNLNPNGSDSFLSYIPPTNVVNNTPDFLYPPIPFLCVNDTTTIFNTANDIDGDSLVYAFTTPFSGFGGVWNPHPNLPAPTMAWPIAPVDYTPGGFSYTSPFSYFGNATINAQNGVATYFSQQQGTFVVCVLVEEYRNGVLLSQTYRDLQLLFNNCPNNHPPQLVDFLQKDYTVTQGDTLCFPIRFRDSENDSVFIEAEGEILDELLTDTPAVFFITQVDSNQTTGNFCWTIPCSLDTGTYEFFVKSYDNGCPPKERYEFYTIRVTPPIPPLLLGADTACKGTDSVLYWMVVDDGFQYQWNITGGVIQQDYGDSVVVSWLNADTAQLGVDVFTATGCYISSDSLQITLLDVPVLYAMPGDTVCLNDTLLLTATGTVNYYWYPEAELLNPMQGDAQAIIQQSGWFYVAGLPGELCPPSDSVYIAALPLPMVTAFTSDSVLCQGDTIHLSSTGAYQYHWSPAGSVFQPDSANTDALPLNNMDYVLMGLDTNQCRNFDTVTVQVHPLPVIGLATASQLCLGDTALFTASGGVLYTWSPNNFLLPDTGSQVWAFPLTNTTYALEITDSNGCTSDTSFNLQINPVPLAGFDFDTLEINCSGVWIQFSNMSTGAVGYQWILGNGNQSDELNPLTMYPFGGSFIVQLIATNAAQCTATWVDTVNTANLQNLAMIQPVNTFTPNNDGLNDVLDFSIPPDFIECSQVYVYDRWGLLMYQSLPGNTQWDGKIDGKPVPEGVYYWIVEVNGIPYQGFVHVFK
jgi:gliding motility-associated-like protein